LDLKKEYVTYGALRFTGGMAISGISVIGILFFLYLLYGDIVSGDIYRWNITDHIINIAGFVIFGFLIWAGRYMDKKQKWPTFTLEIDDDYWIHIRENYDGNVVEHNDIPPDKIIGVIYKKKFYKRKNNWYVYIDFGFMHKGKVYGPFFYGWIVEPKEIREFDKLAEFLKKRADENVKRENIKVPPRAVWYGITSWDQLDDAKKLTEEHLQKLVDKNVSK